MLAHRFSQFAKCQNSTGNTQVLCFLILCAEDVDADKVLRCYPWSRFGGQGLCDRCPRCICCGHTNFSRCHLFPPHFKVSMIQGAYLLVVRTEMQYLPYQRKIELRTRSMNHLLSSVDPVLYDTQQASSRADCFIACFIDGFSVCFFAWAIADCALHRLASQSGAHSLFVHYCSCCVVRFIHHALLVL